MNLTQAVLKGAAEQLNEVLGIDPPINLTLSRTELRNKVREASELVEPSDKLSKATQKVVDHFADEAKAAEPEPEGKGAKKDAKGDAEDAKKPDASKGTSKKDAPAKRPAYTKSTALLDALKKAGKKGSTRKVIAETLDELYVAKGGKSNANGSKAMVDIHLPVLGVFGVVEKVEDRYRLTQ